MTPTMTIYGVRYVEKKAGPVADDVGLICAQCAFYGDGIGCTAAINTSYDAFGGCCVENDVVYAKESA